MIDWDTLIDEYYEGKAVAPLCKAHGCTHSQLYLKLARCGLPLRSETVSEEQREIAAMYTSGMQVGEIQKAVKRSYTFIYRSLERTNTPLRRGHYDR